MQEVNVVLDADEVGAQERWLREVEREQRAAPADLDGRFDRILFALHGGELQLEGHLLEDLLDRVSIRPSNRRPQRLVSPNHLPE